MTTPDELRTTLQQLAALCATLHDDLETDGLHSARTSQTGVRSTTTGSRPPCSMESLDFLVDEVAPRVRGWCYNLQDSAQITGLPMGQPMNVWVAFLARHRTTVLDQGWGEDCAAELRDLTSELHDKLNPQRDTKRPDVGEFATAEDIAHATGRSVTSVKKWCQRNKVEHWDIGGVRQYRTSQVHYQYEHHKTT